ncbi:MAG: hypothetical protein HXN40_09145 [Prevotella histicola]|jgi:hypothetical protein|uniref:TerB family tellurite resistance protein n=1 Tax=Prevotella histicola JCM 15637 = DNF00424 TaxID=1236504 RepID=A0AAW3FG13_9BACT|nr:hypothetical protein [Prevotella histicola]KGF28415.1 hypothetical protein HMPREF2132_04315 [Prevotella histicola JCM 15637 = DNF00424]MBF1423729.1 hypothetical protein [Prevotella histicola]MBW4774916.1 TerB family tellurite resistance protein [Prevotella histicola]
MEGLTYKAKLAIIKILLEILHADGIVNDSEVEYMDEVIKSFNLDENYQSDVDSLITLEALSAIRELSVDQKDKVAKMMGKMIVIDKDINYNEVKLYNTFCKSCDIGKDFNMDDYPEFSLSGPFVNSEDFMDVF